MGPTGYYIYIYVQFKFKMYARLCTCDRSMSLRALAVHAAQDSIIASWPAGPGGSVDVYCRCILKHVRACARMPVLSLGTPAVASCGPPLRPWHSRPGPRGGPCGSSSPPGLQLLGRRWHCMHAGSPAQQGRPVPFLPLRLRPWRSPPGLRGGTCGSRNFLASRPEAREALALHGGQPAALQVLGRLLRPELPVPPSDLGALRQARGAVHAALPCLQACSY